MRRPGNMVSCSQGVARDFTPTTIELWGERSREGAS